MIESKQGSGIGQWRRVGDLILFRCLECGHPMGLQTHQIQNDGTVNPSVVCPHPVYESNPITGVNEDMRSPNIKCGQCSFHNYVKLVGWVAASPSAGGV